MEHRKLDALMTPMERIARVAAAGVSASRAQQTSPSGAISLDNADGTRTIIGEVSNGEDNPSYTMATHVGDTTPPGVPTGIIATSKSGVVVVEWDGTLSGGIPDDFFCVRVYLDGQELGALTEAGSVASAKLQSGTTHQVTAKSEDDCCLPDGTPAHNVSDATQAISVTVGDDAEAAKALAQAAQQAADAAQEIADAAKSEADAHEALIPQIQQSIQDFKDEVDADYYTKTEVDDTTGAITSEMRASYRDAVTQNLSPFYAHDFSDVYNASTNHGGYWVATPTNAAQLSDGWAHVTLDNSSGTSTKYANVYVRPIDGLPQQSTMLIEIANLVTDVTSVTVNPRLWANFSDANSRSQAAGDAVCYFMEDGSYRIAMTDLDHPSATYFSRGWFAIGAGATAEFDARISVYEGEYDGAFKPYVTSQDELGRSYVETAKYTVDQTGVQAALTANATNISNVSGSLESYKQLTDGTLDSLQSQLDGQIEAWYYSVEPTLQNEPARNWTTEELRERHRGDIYYDITTGHSWRWMLDGTAWKWQAIPDSDAAAALAEAQAAMAKAGQKRRIFTATPVAPYDVNDLWLRSYTETIEVGGEQQTSTGPELWYATQLRTGDGSATGEYHEEDWARWIRRSADYSQFANYEFQTDHALLEVGDELWTTEPGSEQRTSRISALEIRADGIQASVSRAYTTGNPNLTPFFAHPGGSYANPGATDYWTSAPIPYASVEQNRGGVREVGHALADGWARYEVDGTKGQNAQGAATTSYMNIRCLAAFSGDWAASADYTLLAEFRNVEFEAGTAFTFLPVQASTASTLSIFQSSSNVSRSITGDVVLRIPLKTYADLAGRTQVTDGFFAVGATTKVAFDVRMSVYESGEGSDGDPVAYAGPYKPYVTDQRELSKTYATAAALRVTDGNVELNARAIATTDDAVSDLESEVSVLPDKIQNTVSKVAQTTRNLLLGCVGKRFGTTTWMSSTDVSDGLWRPYHSETTLSATADGIRADHAGTASGGIAIPLVADGCISAGETLTLSFEYRTNRAGFGSMYVLNAATPNASQGAPANLVADEQWHAFSHTWQAVGNAQVPRALLISYYKAAGAYIEIRDGTMMLSRGEAYVSSSTFTQTVSGMDGRISAYPISSTTLWYGGTDTAPAKPTSHVTSTSTAVGQWTLAQPALTSASPVMWQCVESVYQDATSIATYGWSDPVRLTVADLAQDAADEARSKAGWYGTCSTAAGTAAKAVTVDGLTELAADTLITIRCSTASTTSAPTINVNGLGAKAVWHAGAVTANANALRWAANSEIQLLYDGTKFATVGQPKTYAGASTTAAGTAAKASTVAGFVLCKGASIAVQMTNVNTANNTTLNVSGTGAYAIYLNNARQTTANAAATSWRAGANVTFSFDGQYWRMGEGSSLAEARGEAAARQTLIRQYAGGVLVAYTGNTVGALVNAAGQYDIVSLTWQDGEPTVGNTLASFTATDLLLGLQAENAAVRLLGNTGELYATTAWEDLNDEWGIILRGSSAVGMFASTRGRLQDGISIERVLRRYFISEGQYRMIDDSPMYVNAPHIFLRGGMDQAVTLAQADPDISEGGTGDMTENVRTVALKVPTGGVLGIPTARAGKVEVTEDGLRVDYSTYNASTGIRTTKAGSLMRGVFSGSVVKNPNSSTTMTLLTAAQCQSTFGRALDFTKDVVVVTNGDTDAYGGTITGGTNASGALMATISATKSGAIRYNYLVILGA